MKKVLTLLMLLSVVCAGAWADFAAGYYTIRPYADQTKYVVPSSTWAATGAEKFSYASTGTYDNGGHWVITQGEHGFLIKPEKSTYSKAYPNVWNASSNTQLALGVWNSEATGQSWNIAPVDGHDGVYTFVNAEHTTAYFWYNSSSNYLFYRKTSTPDESNWFVLDEVERTLPFELSSSQDAPDAKWYSITVNGSSYWNVSSATQDYLGKTTTAMTSSNWEQYAFCFVPDGVDGFKIYSKFSGKGVEVTNTADGSKVMMSDNPTKVMLRTDSDGNFYLRDYRGEIIYLAYWSYSHNYVAVHNNSSQADYTGARATFTPLTGTPLDDKYYIIKSAYTNYTGKALYAKNDNGYKLAWKDYVEGDKSFVFQMQAQKDTYIKWATNSTNLSATGLYAIYNPIAQNYVGIAGWGAAYNFVGLNTLEGERAANSNLSGMYAIAAIANTNPIQYNIATGYPKSGATATTDYSTIALKGADACTDSEANATTHNLWGTANTTKSWTLTEVSVFNVTIEGGANNTSISYNGQTAANGGFVFVEGTNTTVEQVIENMTINNEPAMKYAEITHEGNNIRIVYADGYRGIFEINNQGGAANVSRGYAVYSSATPNNPVLAECKLTNHTDKGLADRTAEGVCSYFGVKTVDGKTYIYNLANGKFFGNSSTAWSETATSFNIAPVANSSYLTIQNTANTNNYLCFAPGYSSATERVRYATLSTDGGNYFTLDAVDAAKATELQETYASQIAAAEFAINGWTIVSNGLQNSEVGGVCYNRVNYVGTKAQLPYTIDESALIAMHVSGYNGSVEVNDATKTITVTYSTEVTAGPTLWPDNNNSSNLPAARIPAIVKSQDYILAFSDWRYNRNDIGRGDNGKRIDIEMRRSHDNGQTWEPAIIVAQGTGVTADGYSAAHGDAAVVADRESGKVLMLAASGNTTDFSGSSRSNPIKIGKFTSSDNGANWTKSEVTSTIYDLFPTSVTKIFVTSGKILQGSIKKEGAANYRIYAVLCTNEGNHVIYSDNFGETWGRLGNACTAGNEAHVTELPNGDLLLDSRAGGARYVNVYTYANKQDGMAVLGDSDEQGAWGTYGTMGIPTSGDGCNGDIDIMTAYPAGSSETVKVLLQTSPRSGRNNVSYYYMRLPEPTNGQYNVNDFVGRDKWTSGYEVFHGASAYSSIFHDEQGDVHMLLEKNTTSSTWSYNMTYEKHNISLITNGNYFSVDPTGEKTIKYTLTDVNGTTYEGETTGTMGTAPTFTGCDGMTFNKASWGMEGEKATYTANVVFPFPVGTPTYITGEPSGTLCYWTVNGTTCQTNNTLGATNQEGIQEKWEWIITPSLNNLAFTFTLKNVAADKYITGTSAANTVSVAATGTGYEYKTCMSKKGFAVPNGNVFLSVNSSTDGNKNLILWNKSGTSHTGSDLQFHTPADFNALMTALQAAKTCPGTEGTKVGQYSANNATDEQLTLAQNIIDGTAYATAAKFQELTTAISYTLNMPQPGHFYRLKGVATGKYLTCTNARYNNNDNVYEMAADKTTGDNEKNTILYYGPNNKLVMYGTGYGFANGMQASLDANTTFTFQADTQGAVGKYNVKGVYGSNTIYLWNYSTNLARNGSVTPECVWELEEVEELPVSIGATKFATFYTPVELKVPAGVTAYVCNLNGEDLRMFSCKQVDSETVTLIPAGTAVMLNAPEQAEATAYNFTIPATAQAEEYTNNSFFGSVATKAFATDYTYYSLQRDNAANDGTVGFFIKPSGNFKGFQAFLKTEASQQVQRFNVTFDEDAVITGFANVLGNVNIIIPAFDLSGRKVDANSHRGIYIMNGKKVIR